MLTPTDPNCRCLPLGDVMRHHLEDRGAPPPCPVHESARTAEVNTQQASEAALGDVTTLREALADVHDEAEVARRREARQAREDALDRMDPLLAALHRASGAPIDNGPHDAA